MSRFILASVLVLAYTNLTHPKLEQLPALNFQASTIERIVSASMDAGLPPHIALDRFWHESKWVHSIDGIVLRGDHGQDCGIAQLRERFNPGACEMSEQESIQEGVKQLAGYWNRFHDERLVRVAYTSGLTSALRKANR